MLDYVTPTEIIQIGDGKNKIIVCTLECGIPIIMVISVYRMSRLSGAGHKIHVIIFVLCYQNYVTTTSVGVTMTSHLVDLTTIAGTV